MLVLTRINPAKSVPEGMMTCLSFGDGCVIQQLLVVMLLKEKWRMFFQLYLCKAGLLCCMHLHNYIMLIEVLQKLFFVGGGFSNGQKLRACAHIM